MSPCLDESVLEDFFSLDCLLRSVGVLGVSSGNLLVCSLCTRDDSCGTVAHADSCDTFAEDDSCDRFAKSV
jgi:hypothetical protein